MCQSLSAYDTNTVQTVLSSELLEAGINPEDVSVVGPLNGNNTLDPNRERTCERATPWLTRASLADPVAFFEEGLTI